MSRELFDGAWEDRRGVATARVRAYEGSAAMTNQSTDTGPSDDVQGRDGRALLALARKPDAAAVMRNWQPPTVKEIASLLPRYEFEEMIGRGGMGVVYRARQPALDRLVAIKIVPGEAAADDAFAERFRTEARALVRLQHPHIVAIYDSGETSDGHLFFVMEYVAGSDLARCIAENRLTPARTLEIACAVCAALQFAHERGIVHRDIKPANVLLGTDGCVKVADFGLAQLRVETDADTSRLTLAGTALGTPDYMAPEQRSGGAIDQRSDIYSLGVLLYEMLTGELPRGAWELPSRKAGSDPRLDAVITRAMQTEPAKRYQQASEVGSMVAKIGATTRPTRRPWMLVGFTVLAVALLAIGGALALRPQATSNLGADQPVTKSTAAPATSERALLNSVDLPTHIVLGDWKWLDERVGETLVVPFSEDRALKALRLPVAVAARSYDVSFKLWLEQSGSSAGLFLWAGQARIALVLDLYGLSALDRVRGEDWKTNKTSVRRDLPLGVFFLVEVSVRPAGERVSIAVTISGEPFIQWEGLQSDLSVAWGLDGDEFRPNDPSLLLASFGGGIRIREMKVQLVP